MSRSGVTDYRPVRALMTSFNWGPTFRSITLNTCSIKCRSMLTQHTCWPLSNTQHLNVTCWMWGSWRCVSGSEGSGVASCRKIWCGCQNSRNTLMLAWGTNRQHVVVPECPHSGCFSKSMIPRVTSSRGQETQLPNFWTWCNTATYCLLDILLRGQKQYQNTQKIPRLQINRLFRFHSGGSPSFVSHSIMFLEDLLRVMHTLNHGHFRPTWVHVPPSNVGTFQAVMLWTDRLWNSGSVLRWCSEPPSWASRRYFLDFEKHPMLHHKSMYICACVYMCVRGGCWARCSQGWAFDWPSTHLTSCSIW